MLSKGSTSYAILLFFLFQKATKTFIDWNVCELKVFQITVYKLYTVLQIVRLYILNCYNPMQQFRSTLLTQRCPSNLSPYFRQKKSAAPFAYLPSIEFTMILISLTRSTSLHGVFALPLAHFKALVEPPSLISLPWK